MLFVSRSAFPVVGKAFSIENSLPCCFYSSDWRLSSAVLGFHCCSYRKRNSPRVLKMLHKRAFEDEEALGFSYKLPKQDLCDRQPFLPDISSFEDAKQGSNISVDGGLTKGKVVYEEKFLSREADIKPSPGRADDSDVFLPVNHSFSSGGTSSTSEEDMWIEAPFNACYFPEYFCPERPVTTLTRREDIYSVLLECPPHKKVPIGPLYQADIPPLKGVGSDSNSVISPGTSEDAIRDDCEGEELLAGTSIIPLRSAASPEEVVIKLGHGRTDCSCLDEGSIRCVRQHVSEARDKLKILLGLQVFEELGFSDMGEPVAEKWTEEEENLFREVVFSNPFSMGRKFWNGLSHAFPSRTKAEIVSYYFNVFMLRTRAEQNRFDPVNVDSDNDEWQANEEEEDEDSIVESPIYQLHPLERSQDHTDEFGDNNRVDETTVEDEYTSPVSAHIRRNDDSQADGNFKWRDKTWDERSCHGTQDDSCTSFDNGATGQGLQVK
ncbi:hypothetical protein MLD38_028011 [Melastoma candidum]|uniref:Uncharacterized protein n=1 Tax=Melastoma candidum TaxID=119954 RepID=A0ACB9N1X5_9MYRT|nr:hypothetical protein MLD38_028011 [Melastoma candidum]